jgi:dihydrofolate synthase/folylpolyglutamate synthase
LFNLERVRRLLNILGNPQNHLKCLHVAGTKGKGSACAFSGYILRAAGYRVGLYTSPHLYQVHERIRVLEPQASAAELRNDFYGAITDGEFDVLIGKFRKDIDRVRHDPQWGELTYFEVLTGLALCHFYRCKVDVAVLETGLGGRLDATNAVDAVVNGITPVSFDHMAQLGNTLRKIAAEKAAIIKDSRSRIVVGKQPAEAMTVIRGRCRNLGIKPLVVGKDIRFKAVKDSASAQFFNVVTLKEEYKNLKTGLKGEHQLHNAAIAIGMVESSGFAVDQKAVAQGVQQTRWPGRFEIVHKSPTVIVDCAHNTASAEVLMQALKRLAPGKRRILVLGLSNDKDIRGICKILERDARLILTTQSRHPRAYHFFHKELKELFKDKPALNVKDVAAALKIALREATPKDIIVVAGSVFVAAEARALLRNRI